MTRLIVLLICGGLFLPLLAQPTLIDDFEDAGLGRPENIQNSLFGYWFTYDDRKNNGGTSVASGPTFVSPGADGTQYAAYFSYELGADYKHRFAGMATNIGPHIPSGKQVSDLSNVTEMSLWIKGNGNQLFINFQSPLNEDFNFLCYKINRTPTSWKKYTIKIPQDLEPQWGKSTLSWSKVSKQITALQFKASSQNSGEKGEVWVDEIVLNSPIVQTPAKVIEPKAQDMGEVFKCNFESSPLGTYTYENLARDWNEPDYTNGILDGRAEIVTTDRGKSLKVLYPRGGIGPHEGGVQWITYFKNSDGKGVSYNELYASYVVKAPDTWEGIKGGKLPGLGGGTAPSGGVPVDGTDGFSARLMWRSNSSGANAAQDYLTTYLYSMDKLGQWGDDLWWSSPPTTGIEAQWTQTGKQFLTPGKWDTLTLKITMNTPGQHDGQIYAWLNGEPVLNNSYVRFRAQGVDNFRVGLFYFSTFFGGSTADWAPNKDEVLYFDDFIVSTEPFSYLQKMPAVSIRSQQHVPFSHSASAEPLTMLQAPGQVSISAKTPIQSFAIVNLRGQVVLRNSQPLDKTSVFINTSNLRRGSYVIRVHLSDNSQINQVFNN